MEYKTAAEGHITSAGSFIVIVVANAVNITVNCTAGNGKTVSVAVNIIIDWFFGADSCVVRCNNICQHIMWYKYVYSA